MYCASTNPQRDRIGARTLATSHPCGTIVAAGTLADLWPPQDKVTLISMDTADTSTLQRAEVFRLMEMYRDDMKRMDEERSRASNIILLLTTALVGTQRIGLTHNVSVFVAALGLMGVLIVVKLYERYLLYKALYRETQRKLAKSDQDLHLLGIDFEKTERGHFLRAIQKIKLFHVWIIIHASIFALGTALSF
jgi:hypothetical protein